MNLPHGQIVDEAQLDDAVHTLQVEALRRGMIPIAGILSERVDGTKHRILGGGWNRLREGVPGIHGETGAVIDMGRREGGYANVVATSSLSPCPFCQCTLARHMGIREIRILDGKNYKPKDLSTYSRLNIDAKWLSHSKIESTFERWVTDPANELIWARDIGEWTGEVAPVFDVASRKDRALEIMSIARRRGIEASAESRDAPIGAAIVDPEGQILGCGGPGIAKQNDPSLVAAMSAWRACGARDHWKDKTLFLSHGPDWIAYSMFQIFNFGQLVIGSEHPAFAEALQAVREMGKPVTVLKHTETALQEWLAAHQSQTTRIHECLGAGMP